LGKGWGDEDYTSSDKFAIKLSKKEIKKMKKDAEKEKQKRSTGGSGSGLGLGLGVSVGVGGWVCSAHVRVYVRASAGSLACLEVYGMSSLFSSTANGVSKFHRPTSRMCFLCPLYAFVECVLFVLCVRA